MWYWHNYVVLAISVGNYKFENFAEVCH